MKNILLKSSIIVATVVALTGCGASPKPQLIQTNDTQSIQQKYNYVDNLQDTQISKEDIISSIYRNMHDSSSFRDLTKKRFNSDCSDYYGKDMKIISNSIEINYYRGRSCRYEKGFKDENGIVTYFTLTVPIKITGNNNKYDLVATFPKNYTYRQATMLGIKKQKPVASPSSLLADTKKMFNKISKPLTFSSYMEVNGDINTKYSDSSIYANFERKLDKYTWNNGYKNENSTLVKKNAFALEYKGKRYPLTVKVYPYKNGSKVTYTIGVNYLLSPNGTSSLNTQDIEAMKAMISKVIND